MLGSGFKGLGRGGTEAFRGLGFRALWFRGLELQKSHTLRASGTKICILAVLIKEQLPT